MSRYCHVRYGTAQRNQGRFTAHLTNTQKRGWTRPSASRVKLEAFSPASFHTEEYIITEANIKYGQSAVQT